MQLHAAAVVVMGGDVDGQIWHGQGGAGVVGPFDQLQAGRGEDVSKACVFPFTRVGKTVKIKMRDGQRARRRGHLMRLYDGIAGAFDTALHTQGAQQVAHQRGFASAQITVQLDGGVVQLRLACQRSGPGLRGRLGGPQQALYNRHVTDSVQLLSKIRLWADQLGFSQIGVAPVDLSTAEPGLQAWLDKGFHGDMQYMAAHGMRRARPAELVPGTVSVITARMDYLPRATPQSWQGIEFDRLTRPSEAIVSMYARGRDYHKVLRNRLQKLAEHIAHEVGPLGYRAFTDSAPVLEVELATRSGLGWRGKHTLTLSREAGSAFFLGEIYVDIALPLTEPTTEHCGSCTQCIDICPTQAIIAPHLLDARRCISYLTIEHAGPIPLELRPLIGNRIYGCDDCQLVCPWNKFAQRSALPDFDERAGLSGQQLVTLFGWNEEAFLHYTEGSPIRRIGHERWQRNIAVAMGNALRSNADAAIRQALQDALGQATPLVAQHIVWALG
jgi:epoxyqueuosine reductase